MVNTKEISFVCKDVTQYSTYVNEIWDYGEAALKDFLDVLKVFGMECKYHNEPKGGTRVSIKYPARQSAYEYTHRGSSRELPVPAGSPIRYLTDEEKLEWLDSHTTEEGMAALGLCRSAYFKRKRKMRESLQ